MIKYAAIAYHPNTHEYGYANDCSSRQEAEHEASRNLGSGSVIPAWVADDGYAALARSHNGIYDGGIGQTLREAEHKALNNCSARGGTDCFIVCSVYSG